MGAVRVHRWSTTRPVVEAIQNEATRGESTLKVFRTGTQKDWSGCGPNQGITSVDFGTARPLMTGMTEVHDHEFVNEVLDMDGKRFTR